MAVTDFAACSGRSVVLWSHLAVIAGVIVHEHCPERFLNRIDQRLVDPSTVVGWMYHQCLELPVFLSIKAGDQQGNRSVIEACLKQSPPRFTD